MAESPTVGHLSVEVGMKCLVRMDVVWDDTLQVDVSVVRPPFGVMMIKHGPEERE